MSITSRINEMSSHIEQAYDELQGLGADLTNVNKNIENISMVLDDIYDSMPQVSGEGTSLTLDDTRVGKIKSTLKGNTSQTGTPTPSSPIPVNVVSGDNEIIVNSKNFLKLNDIAETTKNGMTYSCKDGVLTLNGTATSGITIDFDDVFLPAGTYYISRNPTGTTSGSWQNYLRNSSGNVRQGEGSFTTTEGQYVYFRLYMNSGVVFTNYTFKPMVNLGSTKIDFEPYQGNTYNIDLPEGMELCKIGNYQDKFIRTSGKNLFDLTKYQTQSSNTPKVQDEKIVASSPTAWSSICFTFTGLSKNTTYYIKSKLAFTSGGGAYSQIFGGSAIDQSKVIKTYMNNITTSGDYNTSFSTGNNDTITISFCTSGNSGIWSLSNIILSSEDIDYEPFGVGKWYLHKEIGKVVLNGSEDIELDTTKAITQVFKILHILSRGVQENLGICNYFIYQTGDTEKFSYLNNPTDYGQLYIATNKTIASTVQEFKTWLSTHNTTLYYPLATSTNEEITYQPLIDQLNLLEKAMSKDGQTNISQVNNDLPFIISASALKEWQESASLNSTLSMVNPLSLGNTLNTQENDIQPIEVDNIEPLEEEENEES